MKESATTPNKEPRGGSPALLAATVTYMVFGLTALAAMGTFPASSETGTQVVSWLSEHRDGVRWGVWAFAAATPPLAVMIALLLRLLPKPHRDVFLIGAISFVISLAVWTWFWAGLAVHADRLDPQIARTVLDVATFFGPVFTGTTTTMIAPVTILALRKEAGLPFWLGIVGAVAFTEQAIETITIFGSSGFTQPGGAMNFQLGAGLTLLWLLSFGFWGGLRGTVKDASFTRLASLNE